MLNYSFPLTVEDYVHRIGRTGRAGASGISHTFFTDFDKGLAGELVAVLQDAKQEVPQSIYQYPMIIKKKQSKVRACVGGCMSLICGLFLVILYWNHFYLLMYLLDQLSFFLYSFTVILVPRLIW